MNTSGIEKTYAACAFVNKQMKKGIPHYLAVINMARAFQLDLSVRSDRKVWDNAKQYGKTIW